MQEPLKSFQIKGNPDVKSEVNSIWYSCKTLEPRNLATSPLHPVRANDRQRTIFLPLPGFPHAFQKAPEKASFPYAASVPPGAGAAPCPALTQWRDALQGGGMEGGHGALVFSVGNGQFIPARRSVSFRARGVRRARLSVGSARRWYIRGGPRVRGDVCAVIKESLDLFASFLFAELEFARCLLKFSYKKRQYISSCL